ncbi:molecular chaperone [Enterobacteriaceae bacterium C23F]
MFQQLSKPLMVFSLLFSSAAFSGVEIGGTRLIYNGGSNQAAISVKNPDARPYLIQSWVSKSETGDDNDSAFTTTPPLFKLNPNSQNSVRVMLTNNSLPTDRESLYWLNIKAIPTSSPDAKNELLIAIKSKMKLIYRPAGLKGDPGQAYQDLTFKGLGNTVNVHNPTPYAVSLYDLKINGKQLKKPPTILPFQTVSVAHPATAGNEVTWRAINDFGGITAEHNYKM